MFTPTEILHTAAFLREKHLVGNSRRGISGILPISRATLWRKVKDGTFPQPVKLSEHTTAWPTKEVCKWIADPMGYRSENIQVARGQS